MGLNDYAQLQYPGLTHQSCLDLSPFEEQLIYANSAARLLMQTSRLVSYEPVPIPSPHKKNCKIPLRSAKPTRYYRNPHRSSKEEETALSCRLVLRELTEANR